MTAGFCCYWSARRRAVTASRSPTILAVLLGAMVIGACTATCTGSSVGLPQAQCDAWGDMYVAMGGQAWTSCSDLKTDPCACRGHHGNQGSIDPVCDAANTTVKQIVFVDGNVDGTLPGSIGAFENLVIFYVADNPKLHGTIPATVGKWKNLSYLGIRDNAMDGTIPAAVGALPLTALEIYNNNFHGALPPLAYDEMVSHLPDVSCGLLTVGTGHNNFSCPLPQGAMEHCFKKMPTA